MAVRTLDQFLADLNARSEYIKFRSSKGVVVSVYVRKGSMNIKGMHYENVLQRANTSIQTARYARKATYDQPLCKSGAYRELDLFMFEQAKNHGMNGVYVENVLNPMLPDVLLRYGYEEVEPICRCFWKPVDT
jgi:hypothetical protein